MLIGIGHKKRTGKDQYAKYLAEQLLHHGVGTTDIFHFADALKEEVADVCRVSLDFIEANKQKFRPMLQWWGTDFRRDLCGDNYYWIKQTEEKFLNSPANHVIVSDVRFENEARAIKKWGGVLIKIQRETGDIDPHPSETELDGFKDWDFVITNEGSLLDLLNKANAMAKLIKNKILT